jgi:hypothetical protein
MFALNAYQKQTRTVSSAENMLPTNVFLAEEEPARHIHNTWASAYMYKDNFPTADSVRWSASFSVHTAMASSVVTAKRAISYLGHAVLNVTQD